MVLVKPSYNRKNTGLRTGLFRWTLMFLLTFSFWPNFSLAQEAVDPNFDPGLLISDAAFEDAATFGSAAGVQQFLQGRGSLLANTSQDFLIKLREPTDIDWKTRLEDPRPSLSRLRTAAELIYDASTAAGINPQVILVTLQKEQSLITGSFSGDSLQARLDRALGYGCPDNQPCQASFLGFYNQLFGTFDAEGSRWIGAPKALMRSFTYTMDGARVARGPLVDAEARAFGSGPFVRMSKKGDTVIFENTLGGFAGVGSPQTVTMKNFATTALYRYTPHVFNGNYNFWRFYNTWFKYPNGTVIKSVDDNTQLWVIENGQRFAIAPFAAAQRGISTESVIVVSPTELQNYIDGGKLLPLEGSLLRADGNLTVYVMLNGQKRPVSFGVFQQRKFSFANVNVLSPAEVAGIPTGPILPPLDGTLIKGENSMAVYFVENGTKRVFSYHVFIQRGYSFRSVTTLTTDEMAALPAGLPVAPLDNTLIKTADSPAIFMVKNGSKAFVTFGVYMLDQLYARPHMVLSQHEMDSLPAAAYPLAPRDGRLVRAKDNPTVYLVENGKLRPLTYEAFVARKFKFSQVVVMDPSEVTAFEKGEAIIK